MPRAYVIRYDKRTANPFFPGQLRDEWSQPESPYPHWEICEPRIRKALDEGSLIFFVPKGEWRVKHVLKVERKENAVEATARLGPEWRCYYDKQVWCHKGRGAHDIIIGSITESFSLPGKGEDISKEIPLDWKKKRTIRNNGTHVQLDLASNIYQRLFPLRVKTAPKRLLTEGYN